MLPGKFRRRIRGLRPVVGLSSILSQLTAWISYSRLPHTSQTHEGKFGTVMSSSFSQVK